MDIRFVAPENGNGPKNLLSNAEVHFGNDGPMAGMKLIGFSVWRGANDERFVTFPARAIGSGSDKKYFDFLRTADGPNAEVSRGVKAWVLGEYDRQIGPSRAAESAGVASLAPPMAVPTAPSPAPSR